MHATDLCYLHLVCPLLGRCSFVVHHVRKLQKCLLLLCGISLSNKKQRFFLSSRFYTMLSEDPQEAKRKDAARWVGWAERTTKHEVLEHTYTLSSGQEQQIACLYVCMFETYIHTCSVARDIHTYTLSYLRHTYIHAQLPETYIHTRSAA